MSNKIQAVFLAGGKGKRLGTLGNKIPKALVKVNKISFLDIIINQLKKNGIKNFLILSGYKKEQIINHFNSEKNIQIIKGNSNWQTLTRIIKAKTFIKGKFFLLMYCDNFLLNFNLKKNLNLKKKTNSKIIFSVVDKKKGQKGKIFLKKNHLEYKNDNSTNYVEAGYMLINKNFFFGNLKRFKNNDLSKYLEYLSKKNSFVGEYYGDNFCV